MDIVIFGTAKMADETYEIISHLSGYNVVAFSDNNKQLWNTIKYGLEIIPPKDIRCKYRAAAIVIASSYFSEIGKQLSENDMVPEGGYLDSVNQVIGKLSDEERAVLKGNIHKNICFYNLDYKEIELVEVCDSNAGKYLVICNGGYPAENNPRCAFVHRRVLQYQKEGISVEAFGFIEGSSLEIYEYQGVKVYQGGIPELQKLLKRKDYKKLMIHFMSKNLMYAIWQTGKMDMPMLIWCHGYEVMPWTRCWYNFTDEEIRENKTAWNKMDRAQSVFIGEMFEKENIHFIFVSAWQKGRVKKFAGRLPKNHSVIHNFIDCEFYKALERNGTDRLHILSIKNHKNRTYANDLTAKAILELADRSFFSELTFELYGDGRLFEENFSELIEHNYSNVHIHKGFLSQDEMKEHFSQNGIFLSPTRMDCHEVTASEAMSAGMVVITCNIGPMHEFIDEECGSLFECNNYLMMAEEIEYLYYHPEEFVEKGKNANARAEKQCGYDSTVKREIELILGQEEEHSDGTGTNKGCLC